jgi:citrate lyase subunit beta/citryl-CoA lyase
VITLTLLYVPADRPDRARKALASPADVVVLDLEDAVAPAAKAQARLNLAGLVAARPGRQIQARVNAVGTPWAADDVAAVAALPVDVAVRVPKAEDPAAVREIASAVGAGRPLHLLLESAAGIEAAFELATACGQVASIAIGEADLRSDLGVDDPAALAWARGRVVMAARAAGLPAPMMSVFTALDDPAGLAESTRQGARIGFVGRAAIHPSQLHVIESAFTPSPEQIERARLVVESVEGALAAGTGTVVLPGGEFMDVAMLERARKVLRIAERVNAGTAYPLLSTD